MTTGQPPEHFQLDRFVSYPREDIDVEYKGWLNLSVERDRATLAKAAIALANHGGGHIILGFQEEGQALQPAVRPPDVPEITQDAVNAAIRRYAEPESHCQMYIGTDRTTGRSHPIIRVQASDVPVMCKRDQQDAGVSQHRYYVRKPGPRSEEPHTEEEWRRLLDRCVRARREDMLDAMRSIVLGHTEAQGSSVDPLEELNQYCTAARERWIELASDLPIDSPSRFPHGYYEMGFALVGATPAAGLAELNRRLGAAQAIKLSGWTPFLDLPVDELKPHAYDGFIEAWVGRPVERLIGRFTDPGHADFWRASVNGELYTIRGYIYDGSMAARRGHAAGEMFDVEIPILDIGEGIMFASRFAEEYDGVEQIAISCRFTGLSGRSLVPINLYDLTSFGQYVCHTPEVVSTSRVTLQQVRDNLPEIVHGMLQPLYEHFDFFPLSIARVQRSLQELKP